MAVQTYTEQLERVQLQIQAIEEGGQSYGIAGRSLTRADLETLYKREERLRALVDREDNNSTGMRVRRAVPYR